ncbi:unnamed protein product [Amaranthus hypochondriacus]
MLDKGRKRLKDNDDVFEAFKSTDEDGFVDLYVVGGNPGKGTTSNTTNMVEPNVGKRRKPLTSPSLDSSRIPQKLQPDVEKVTPRKKHSARRGPSPRKRPTLVPQPHQQPEATSQPPSQTPTEPQPQPEAAPPHPSQTPPQPQPRQLDPVVEQTQVDPPIQPTQVDPLIQHKRSKIGAKRALFIDEDEFDNEEQPQSGVDLDDDDFEVSGYFFFEAAGQESAEKMNKKEEKKLRLSLRK